MTKTTEISIKNEEVTYNNLDDLLEGGIRVGHTLSFVAAGSDGKSKLKDCEEVQNNV